MVDVLEHQSQKWIDKWLDLHRHDDKSRLRYRTNLPKSQTLKQTVSKQERERERERERETTWKKGPPDPRTTGNSYENIIRIIKLNKSSSHSHC